MVSDHDPFQNELLAALTEEERRRVFPYLELVKIALGDVLYSPYKPMMHAYFPTTAIVSLLQMTQTGATAELAMIGKEGFVGISLFMGGDTTSSWAMVQNAGYAYKLPAKIIKEEFWRGGKLQHLLLCFTQTLITQMAQTAVCNRHHTVEQHLCHWLLLSLDRLSSNDFNMTHELIANMLGVRRESVTEAAGHLQRDGLIHYTRGKISIRDRTGLENRACECYHVVKVETDRLRTVAE